MLCQYATCTEVKTAWSDFDVHWMLTVAGCGDDGRRDYSVNVRKSNLPPGLTPTLTISKVSLYFPERTFRSKILSYSLVSMLLNNLHGDAKNNHVQTRSFFGLKERYLDCLASFVGVVGIDTQVGATCAARAFLVWYPSHVPLTSILIDVRS